MEFLFRSEVYRQGVSNGIQPVRIFQPPRLRLLTAAAVLAAAAVFAYLSTATYTRKATLPGLLMPPAGVVRLAAPQPGVVIEQRVAEGQLVKQGEVLFVLRPVHAALLAPAQTEVERSLEDRHRTLLDSARLQQQLTGTRLVALERRLKAQQAELLQLDAEIAAQQQRLALSRESLERLRTLQAQQFLSPAQVQSKEEEVLAIQAILQSLRRQRAAIERERAELEGERSSLPIQGAQQQSELSRNLAELARERAEQDPKRQFTVTAPADGRISALLAQAGQTVVEGSPLASFQPAGDGRLQVQLLAPAAAVGLLREGQAVRIRYDAFPFQRFGLHAGRVMSVSPLPLTAADVAALPLPPAGAWAGSGSEPRYRVTATLDADPGPAMPQPLRAGMALQADVALDTRRWIEWLFAPALGMAQRL